MEDALTVHRLHFAFTVTFHYVFPQLTMALALLILVMKTIAALNERGRAAQQARRGGRWRC
jgi:cytochrome bd ubiquinol oxidase subunit I